MTQMQATWRDVDISAYVDGELNPAAQAAFEVALGQDHTLRQKVDDMREVVALVRAIPLREPPRNYLLTPSMVAEKSPQQTQRRPMPQHGMLRHGMPLLFMRLATSLAAVAFVVTAGLTFVQRGITPMMMTQAPKTADERMFTEAPQAVVATVVVSEETEVMLFSAPEAMPAPDDSVEEGARSEKVVEAEQPIAAMAPAPPAATPQPNTGTVEAYDMMNAQGPEEAAPQEEALTLESAPAAEAQVVSEAERTLEDSTGTLSGAGEGERMGYDAAEPTAGEPHEIAIVKSLQTPSWWTPAILGAMTLLLAGITYWMSRRR